VTCRIRIEPVRRFSVLALVFASSLAVLSLIMAIVAIRRCSAGCSG
jgi:hypothetical protein